MTEQLERVGALPPWVGVGKVLADVAKASGAEQRIGDCVCDGIGIGVAVKATFTIEHHTTEHQHASRVVGEAMDVEALAYTHLHGCTGSLLIGCLLAGHLIAGHLFADHLIASHLFSGPTKVGGVGDLSVAGIAGHHHHAATGGFGSAVLEVLQEAACPAAVERIGWPDRFIEHDTPEVLWQPHLLTHPNGVIGLDSVTFAAEDPTPVIRRLANLLQVLRTHVTALAGGQTNPATGDFVRNAEVRLEGTPRVTYTENDGSFQFAGVPAGSASISISFTGYNTARETFTVSAGQVAIREINLVSTGTAPAAKDGVVKLEAFTVSSAREGNSKAIMAQRRDMNIITSVSSDIFGEVTDGNVGEFLKYLPGVDVGTDVTWEQVFESAEVAAPIRHIVEPANEQNLSLEQIKAKLADTAIRERGKKELFGAEQRLKLAVGSGI